MKPITVNYQKVFPLAPYVNERIGVDIQLDDGDSPLEALAKAKEMVEQFHRNANKGVVLEAATPETTIPQPLPIVQTEKPSKEDRIAKLISEIYTCRELKVLESYALLAKAYPEAMAAYEAMKTKLQ